MKYRKKPVVIEAFRMGIDYMPDWFFNEVANNNVILRSNAPIDVHIEQRKEYETSCEIKTLEGVMVGNYGDYIIKGVQGELYPCKQYIFEQTYEELEDFFPKDLGNGSSRFTRK